MKDKRLINKVWEDCNRLGEWHTFAYVGTGKGRVLVTLHAGAMTPCDEHRMGDTYFKYRNIGTGKYKQQLSGLLMHYAHGRERRVGRAS